MAIIALAVFLFGAGFSGAAEATDDDTEETLSVAGTVERFDATRTVRGAREAANLAQLRLTSGETILVDIGPERSTADLNISPGDSIHISGTIRQVAGQSVVQVDELEINGVPSAAFVAPF